MESDRACMIMAVKTVDEDKRIITRIASVPSPDRDGDIVDPDGVRFGNENPFLWQHDRTQPIGNCSAKKVKEGLQTTAQLVKPIPNMPSQLVARLEEVRVLIKSGLVKGPPIGSKPVKYAYLDSGGIHFLEWELPEVPAVTIPANAERLTQVVKSFDHQSLAALGTEKPVAKTINSVGASALNKSSQKGKPTTNIAEQIKSLEDKCAALASSLDDIMSKAADEGRTLDAEETESCDSASIGIKAVDEHLKRPCDMENSMTSTTKPTTKAASDEVIVANNALSIIHVEPKLEKGIVFARFAKSLAAGNGSHSEALQIAKNRYPDDTKPHHVLKAAVSAGTTTDPVQVGALVEYQDYAQDFIELLRLQTIIGRFGQGNIPSLRQVSFNVRIPAQTLGGSANWVGQGRVKPLTKFDFATIAFGFSKVASVTVLTEELTRSSSPSADVLVCNALVEAVIARLDTDFTDPAKAAAADVSLAPTTNGITAILSTGDSDTDVAAAFGKFITNNLQPNGAIWLMFSTTAPTLSMRKNTLGQKEYPDTTTLGGTFQGPPIVVSQYASNQLVLVNASDVYLADDGGVAVDMSREASLEMQSAPTHDSTTSTAVELVSMFQTNSVATCAERWINWKYRCDAAVAVVSDADYSTGATS